MRLITPVLALCVNIAAALLDVQAAPMCAGTPPNKCPVGYHCVGTYLYYMHLEGTLLTFDTIMWK